MELSAITELLTSFGTVFNNAVTTLTGNVITGLYLAAGLTTVGFGVFRVGKKAARR